MAVGLSIYLNLYDIQLFFERSMQKVISYICILKIKTSPHHDTGTTI